MALALVVAACAEGGTEIADTTPQTLATTSTTVPPPTTSTTTTTRALSGPGYGGIAIIADDQAPPTLNPFAPQGDNFIVQIIA